jgi:hypothetical protein
MSLIKKRSTDVATRSQIRYQRSRNLLKAGTQLLVTLTNLNSRNPLIAIRDRLHG